MKIIELEETDSTNEYLKRLGYCGDVIVTARRQTAGRGTKGRSFSSSEGGVYLSVMRFYEDLPPAETFKIMINSCVAVCRTVESFSVKPEIRWANDVLVGGKKICGTLIENVIKDSGVLSVAGIGINVNNRLPEELADIAVTLSDCAPRRVAEKEVERRLIKNIGSGYSLDEYKSYIKFFGSEITVITDFGTRRAIALDVCTDGRLKVMERDGGITLLSAAEVSLSV